ncbi:polymeric immunoglobulin receptor-like [Pelmatolapia mariae]|uniref:polymeric immunoglobulin receptor-like n=1 Tax=Pelmatolapia mariae TaxID=158779 RepID=UPI002FE5DBEB
MSALTASRCSTLLFVGVFVFVSADQKIIITAEPGQDVTLTCRAPNNNITGVEWSRADLTDEHVLLYRDGKFDLDNQHQSFKNRSDLQDRQMKDGDVSLILKHVTINDAGPYVCGVFIEGTQSSDLISIIKLRVVDPPEQKLITAEPGQDVTLTCRAPNNITGVEWSRADLGDEHVLLYRDGKFDLDNQHQSFKNRSDLQDRQMKDGDVSLILKHVTINDAGTYECGVYVVERNSLKILSSIYLHVVPPDQKIITAEPGQDVTLPCRAPNKKIRGVIWSRTDKPPFVVLYQDGRFVIDDQHPTFKNRVDLQDRQMKDGDVSLILKNVAINDTGTYMCRVLMERTGSLKLISIVYLSVPAGQTGGHTEDGGKKDGEQKNITAESGQNATLTCRAPNNKIRVVKWSRADLTDEHVFMYQDKPDSANQHPSFKNRTDLQDRQMKDGNVSLILKNVTINDTGTYMCRVFMNKTKSWSNISIIHLHVVPPDKKNITAEPEEQVKGPVIKSTKLNVPAGHTDNKDEGTENGSFRLIVGLSVSAVLLLVVALVINLICRKYEKGFSTIKQQERMKRKKAIERSGKYSKLNSEPDC